MGPIWGWQDPGGPHVGPMNLAIWDGLGGWVTYMWQSTRPSLIQVMSCCQLCAKPISERLQSIRTLGRDLSEIWKNKEDLHYKLHLKISSAKWSPFLTLGLFGRRVIVVTCVCPSVRLSVCPSVRLSVCLFPSSLLTQSLNQFIQ